MHRFSCCLVVAMMALSMTSVDAWFLGSVAGITSDIVKNPLESLSLFALKSYLLGHVNGRVTQYRQMAYNGNRPYSASSAPAPYASAPAPYSAASAPVPVQVQAPAQYHPVQYSPSEQYYNVRARRSVEKKMEQQALDDDRQQFLEMAEKLDNNKCIPRLVCEVMAGESVTERGQFEELVAKVFGEEVPEVSEEQKVFSSVYHFAAFSGRKAENGDYCRTLFPKCKASETEFRKIADRIFTEVDDEAEVLEAMSDVQ